MPEDKEAGHESVAIVIEMYQIEVRLKSEKRKPIAISAPK
jgi:hypothetical protein